MDAEGKTYNPDNQRETKHTSQYQTLKKVSVFNNTDTHDYQVQMVDMRPILDAFVKQLGTAPVTQLGT
jgi:translation initiation factor IF-3